HHIVRHGKDWNRRCCLLYGANCSITGTKNDIGSCSDQLHRNVRKLFGAHSIAAPVNGEILTLYEAQLAQFIEKHGIMRSVTWTGGQAAEAIGLSRLLRTRRERPRDRTAKQHDEVAPSQSIELHPLPQARVAAYRIGEHQVRGLPQCGISTRLMTGWGHNPNGL